MTKKRFTIKPSMIVDDVTVIIDSEKQYSFPVLDSTLNFMFCKVLNELSDENKQLKKAIDEADDLIKSHLSAHYNRRWENICEHLGVDLND